MISAGAFARFLTERYGAVDGYIMGATGQDPAKWPASSWYFAQYKGDAAKYRKALYWREHAQRVWDCQGLSEGYVKDCTGQDVNTKARYNYGGWCDPKGAGLIPAEYRVPGAAVFWGDTAGTIHHVAYLTEPVKEGRPEGDWWMVEARSVTLGVCRTKLLSRKPNFWGLMTKYFDYGALPRAEPAPEDGCPYPRPASSVRRGDRGEAVRWAQWHLWTIDPDSLPRYGVDGIFGRETQRAVKAYQKSRALRADGIVGKTTGAALAKDAAKGAGE